MIENRNEAIRNLEKALEQAKAMLELAKQGVQSIQYVKIRNTVLVERELQNESRQHNKQQSRTKRRVEEI